MAPFPMEPIMLFGFDFEMQTKNLVFDKTWAAAFLHPRFINEDHPALRGVYQTDALKKREVRYGNNVAMLFRAALYLGQACGQPRGNNFWPALARAFSTRPERIKHMVDTLTEARRARRSRVAKETSDTARAADGWIEFIDRCQANDVIYPSLSELEQILEKFLDGYKKSQINASNVPLNNRPGPPPRPNVWRRPSPDPRLDPPPHIKTEYSPTSHIPTGPSASRKRSISPPPVRDDPNRTPIAAKRARHDAGDQSSPVSPRSTIPQSAAVPVPAVVPAPAPAAVPLPATNIQQEQQQQHQPSPPQPELRLDIDMETTGSRKPDSVDQSANEAQVEATVAATAEKLCETEDKSSPADDAADPSKQLLDEVNALVQTEDQLENAAAQETASNDHIVDQMDGMKNVMESMMDSMHAIVDDVHSMKDDLAQVMKTPSAGTTTMDSIETLNNSVLLLREEVASLKSQSQRPPASDVRDLVLEQGRMLKEMAAHITGQQPRIRFVAAHRQPPRNLEEALQAAGSDLRYHLQTITALYHQSNPKMQVAQQTVDVITALEDGVMAIQGRPTR